MKYTLLAALIFIMSYASAQTTPVYRNNLSKLVTFNIRQQTVRSALQEISTAGNFYFSYNGKLIRQDSLVSLNASRMPVREVLDKLFNGKVDYKETGEYIILRYAVNHFTIEPEDITTAENQYAISGYVVDTRSGKRVKQASVYEKRLLQSTLTDEQGFFSLRFKGRHEEVILTASKETYRDTSLVFLSDIHIGPRAYADPDKEKGFMFSNAMENLGISRFLLSSKQRIQSLNISNFFAHAPVQASLLPGLSSHGMMSGRIVNKASLNVLGGYTAGVQGAEVGGLFNLSIGDVKSFQAAGLFNAVGGKVEGFQAAGIINAVQNRVDGMQAAGVVNIVNGTVEGMQTAGVGNIAAGRLRGTQVASVFNYAGNMEGVQIGLVNLSDTLSGTAIGLLNLSRNGYKKLVFYANELINANLALKTGNANLYSLLFAGKNYVKNETIGTFGLGFGHDFVFGKSFALGTELTGQYLHLGNWNQTNLLARFQTQVQIRLFKGLSLFGGPAYSYYTSRGQVNAAAGYKQDIVPTKHYDFDLNNKGWWGWNAGISLF